MSKCHADDCNNEIFSHNFCKYHGYMRKRQGGDLFKRKPNKLPVESKKRKEEKKYYSQNCKELEQEIRNANNGKIYCFFSGLEINERVSFHHTKSRIKDFYTDKQWLVPCINKYHLEYHFKPVEWLLKQDWYEGFLKRLDALDPTGELLRKELKKQDKVHKINPTFDFDENDDD